MLAELNERVHYIMLDEHRTSNERRIAKMMLNSDV